MTRLFLIHLGRFLRCYLLACFGSVLLVPLSFNIYDVITQNGYRNDLMFLCTAVLPGVIAAGYTWYQRRRVNSDEILFFVRNRLRLHPELLRPYFALTGVLLREVGFDLNEHQRKFLAALHLADEIEREALATQAAANATAMGLGDFELKREPGVINELRLDQLAAAAAQTEALGCVETIVLASNLTLKRKNLELSKQYLLQGLNPEGMSLEQALKDLQTAICGYGPYFEAWVAISLTRSVMNALPPEQHRDFNALRQNPVIHQVSAALLANEVAYRCAHNFSFMLNQEVYRLRHRAAFIRQQFEQAQAAARARRQGETEQTQGTKQHNGYSFRQGPDDAFSYGSYYYHGYYEPGQDPRYGAEHEDFEGSRYSYRDHYERDEGADEPKEELTELQKAYQILGVSADDSVSTIKAQYRRLAFRFHPDHIKDYLHLSPGQQRVLNAKFQEICAAYSTVMASRQ